MEVSPPWRLPTWQRLPEREAPPTREVSDGGHSSITEDFPNTEVAPQQRFPTAEVSLQLRHPMREASPVLEDSPYGRCPCGRGFPHRRGLTKMEVSLMREALRNEGGKPHNRGSPYNGASPLGGGFPDDGGSTMMEVSLTIVSPHEASPTKKAHPMTESFPLMEAYLVVEVPSLWRFPHHTGFPHEGFPDDGASL